MVLDMARLKNKQGSTWPGMRGRDAARKLTLNVNILQVFTIDFSEIQFIVNHNSQSDEQNKSAYEWDELAQEDHAYRLTPEEKKRYQGQWYLYLEQSRQKWAYETSIWFSSRCLNENRLHHESGEQVAEPVHPHQYRSWHPSSTTSWWDKSWMELEMSS